VSADLQQIGSRFLILSQVFSDDTRKFDKLTEDAWIMRVARASKTGPIRREPGCTFKRHHFPHETEFFVCLPSVAAAGVLTPVKTPS
jgi:hypothetical protein